ncbi:hypothetical protein CQP30_15050 [Yersinia pestis]|uniref:Uncharacterized protein n=2 Tax=Yersinia pestis TaxID=632 RepID=Q7ARJ3_YERPE|nr:unknown [Yersinia pestis]AAS58580.1 hypothetical protein YP_pCD65 [Yersinia pestis biovar Microtus str. 91001]ABR14862.1 hypothetical protein YPCD1.22c [Yersinia pestis CA88-4125]ADW01050.1 hypothetical protein YPCD1.22c [Yersinia pestis biovar Medievalis str. Harbin 35]EEO78789.1 hypothetical protein YPF_4715 [Yersinia pestis biovar Orientalis str. India 195]EEO88142.1 hypothetical protein YPS_4675 [Yersinia pestis Pestoides A]OSZ83355.1 hypothetical protein A7722_21650 [Yersinia pestis s
MQHPVSFPSFSFHDNSIFCNKPIVGTMNINADHEKNLKVSIIYKIQLIGGITEILNGGVINWGIFNLVGYFKSSISLIKIIIIDNTNLVMLYVKIWINNENFLIYSELKTNELLYKPYLLNLIDIIVTM